MLAWLAEHPDTDYVIVHKLDRLARTEASTSTSPGHSKTAAPGSCRPHRLPQRPRLRHRRRAPLRRTRPRPGTPYSAGVRTVRDRRLDNRHLGRPPRSPRLHQPSHRQVPSPPSRQETALLNPHQPLIPRRRHLPRRRVPRQPPHAGRRRNLAQSPSRPRLHEER